MKRMGLVFAWVLVSAIPALPGDDWQKKSFTGWSKDDVLQVLQDSPWVRQVRITQPGKQILMEPGIAESSTQTGLTQDQEENAAIARRDFKPMNRVPDQMPNRVETAPVRLAKAMALKVRWLSSRTIREAVARYWMLQGVASADAAKKLVAYQPEQFAIGLGPVRVSAQSKEQVEEALDYAIKVIGDSAYISVDGGKPLAPMAVEAPKGVSLTPAAGVILYFPMQVAGGPLIPTDAKRVRFHCNYEAGDQIVPVDVEFDITKMKRDAKLDL